MTEKTKKVKKVKAWAIVDSKGCLSPFDYRLPICWLRKMAKEDNDDRFSGVCKVVPCVVTYSIPEKKK